MNWKLNMIKKYKLSIENTVLNIILLAFKYKNDINLFKFNSLKDMFYFLRSKYGREIGEILHRPIYYKINKKFDCDDYSIFFLAYLINKNVNLNNIYIVLAGKNKITHIYIAVYLGNGKFAKFDPLPQNFYDRKKIYPIEKFFKLTDILNFFIDKKKNSFIM